MRPENRQQLGPHDIILATHPGSGTSWIATLLVRLGIFYVSGDDELLLDSTSQRTQGVVEKHQLPPGATEAGKDHIGIQKQLDHLPALRDRDQDALVWREPNRVIKTSGSAIGFKPPGRVLLLVRDGRDALLSLYHHYVNFSDLDVPLPVYLSGNDGAWVVPAVSWGFSTMSWLGTPADRLHVLKFEDCKQRPLEEFRAMLVFLGIERTDEEIEAAIEASSYKSMRKQENAAIAKSGADIGKGRIMRRGQVGEWREVYTDDMLATFSGMPRRALAALGYSIDDIPT